MAANSDANSLSGEHHFGDPVKELLAILTTMAEHVGDPAVSFPSLNNQYVEIICAAFENVESVSELDNIMLARMGFVSAAQKHGLPVPVDGEIEKKYDAAKARIMAKTPSHQAPKRRRPTTTPRPTATPRASAAKKVPRQDHTTER